MIQTRPRLCALMSTFLISITWSGIVCAQGADAGSKAAAAKELPPAAAPANAEMAVVVAAARERAKLLHDVYSSTLDVIHHYYFRRDGAVLPARAMEDVFDEMAKSTGGLACWISVNTKAMSINHEPATPFEKKAAEALATGKDEYELVGKKVYQRAAPIPLGSRCVGCHTKMFDDPPKSPRFAALVISLPLKVERKK